MKGRAFNLGATHQPEKPWLICIPLLEFQMLRNPARPTYPVFFLTDPSRDPHPSWLGLLSGAHSPPLLRASAAAVTLT